MIISNNRDPHFCEFQQLVESATLRLNDDARGRGSYYITRSAQKLEDDVLGFLNNCAQGTKFEGTIQKISGQRFPDIVAAKYYGVEVKSSKDERWISLGGSINESTRVDGVERIFLIFGKLTNPVEFRSRLYEECLSEVVVTHYPRYKIDMNLLDGATIFDKMNTTYDDLRLSQDPVGTIVDYYKSQLADGESLWWTGNKDAHMKIRLMRTLSAIEKKEIMIRALAYFPEILGNASNKYERYALWLAANYGIISTSTRDLFSAGGQGTIGALDKIPRKLLNIYENKLAIHNSIISTASSVLCETWQVDSINHDPVSQWVNLLMRYCLLPDTQENKELNEKISCLLSSLCT